MRRTGRWTCSSRPTPPPGYFRYARIHFDLDAHDSYTTTATRYPSSDHALSGQELSPDVTHNSGAIRSPEGEVRDFIA
jgi:hypothetical protein